MPDDRRALRLYRLLLWLYPAGFRDQYAAPMERAFRDELEEAGTRMGRFKLWLRLLGDLALSLPPQIAHEFSQDFRHTLRLWARRPWFAVFAIGAMAIGIGANTAAFSAVNDLLLRALPFQDPDRLAVFTNFVPPHRNAREFHDWRQRTGFLANAALWEGADVNLDSGGVGHRVHASQVSWNFFATLGVPLAAGRGFVSGDDENEPKTLVVISYSLWQQLYGGGPQAIGAVLRVDGQALTVAGVAPPGFDYPTASSLWIPGGFSAGNNGWEAVVRLQPGVSYGQARAALQLEAPLADRDAITVRSLRDGLAGPAKGAYLILLGAVALVLLTACLNVANLMLARTAARAPEFAIRSALGASRGRLVQQLLTEAFLLALSGALAGTLVFWTYSSLNLPVLAYTFGITLGCGLLFGSLPVLGLGRVRLFREGLAAAQILLTVVLLSSSVSVGRAFQALMGQERGYDVSGLVTVSVALDGTSHQRNKSQLAYFEGALARIRALPGVRSASATEFLPLYATGFVGGPFGLDGRKPRRNATMIPVLAGYFGTMGGRILHGREFTDAEVRTGSQVAVVNERFAAQFGSLAEAIGHRVTAGRTRSWQIVGVVQGMEFETDRSLRAAPQVYLPSGTPGSFFSTFVARVDGRAENQVAAVRDAIRSADPAVPVFGAMTMEQRLAEHHARPRLYRTLIWCFTGFTLLLALLGVYGIVEYTVVQRTRELGVRLALGSTAGSLRAMLLTQGLAVVGAGALAGLLGAWATGRYLESLLEGARPLEAPAAAVVALFLLLVAAASIWSATRRVAGLDILSVLRAD